MLCALFCGVAISHFIHCTGRAFLGTCVRVLQGCVSRNGIDHVDMLSVSWYCELSKVSIPNSTLTGNV